MHVGPSIQNSRPYIRFFLIFTLFNITRPSERVNAFYTNSQKMSSGFLKFFTYFSENGHKIGVTRYFIMILFL